MEWDRLVEMTGGGIFLTYDWCRIWWRYYGHNRKAYIFLFRIKGRLVGLVPVFIDRFGFKLLNIVIAKIFSSEYILTICNPTVIQAYSHEIYETVQDYLFTKTGCDMVVLGPALETNQYQINIKKKNVKKVDLDISTSYQLPGSFNEYLNKLSRNERKHYKHNYKKLIKEYDIRYDVCQSIKETVDSFEDFMVLHRTQWKKIGKLGHFEDWPQSKNFHREMIKEQYKKKRLRLFKLSANGDIISYRYLYYFGNKYYSFLPARLTEPPWDKSGLGRVAHILTVKKAIEENVKVIDAGRGFYDHKLFLGGKILKVFLIRITANGLLSRAKSLTNNEIIKYNSSTLLSNMV